MISVGREESGYEDTHDDDVQESCTLIVPPFVSLFEVGLGGAFGEGTRLGEPGKVLAVPAIAIGVRIAGVVAAECEHEVRESSVESAESVASGSDVR